MIKDISVFLQKLFKYFKGNDFSASFLPVELVVPVIFCLDLNGSIILPSSNQPYSYNLKLVHSFLNIFYYILTDYTLTSLSQDL